VKIVDVKKFPN